MRITFINVGYGEAILIETYNKSTGLPNTVMIDGGSGDPSEFEGSPQRIRAADYLKEKGIAKIDLLIGTHIHEDHICGLYDIVDNADVKEFWCNYEIPDCYEDVFISAPPSATESQIKFVSAVNCFNKIYFTLKRKEVTIRQIFGLKPGIILENGLSADILGPSERDYKFLKFRMDEMYSSSDGNKKNSIIAELDTWINMVSIMLRFHFHGIRMFLPADVNKNGYGHLTDSMDLIGAEIFKAAHHGQIDGISEELARLIHPSIIVTCASSDLRYRSSNIKTYEIIEKSLKETGGEPKFLFSDDVRIKNYSENIKSHRSVVIEIDEKDSQLNCMYI
jgi:competence protein ComEC